MLAAEGRLSPAAQPRPAALIRPHTSATVRLWPEAARRLVITQRGESLSLCTEHPQTEARRSLLPVYLLHRQHDSISAE